MATAAQATRPLTDLSAGSAVLILNTVTQLFRAKAGAEVIAAYVALACHADFDGRCFPSQTTLGEGLGRSRSWVNRTLGELEAHGVITKTARYQPKGGRTSNEYRLVHKVQLSPGRTAPMSAHDTPPVRPGDRNLNHTDLEKPVDAPAREATPAPRPVGKANEEGKPKPDGEVVPLPVGTVARRIQRCSRRPWRLETALQVVQATIAQAGLEAVQQLASVLEAEPGGLDPWVITSRLKALGHPQPSSVPPDTPSAADDRREPPAQVAPASPLPPGLTDDAVRWLRRRVEPQHLRYLTGADRVTIEGDTATIVVATPFAVHMIHSQFDHLLSAALGVRSVRVLSRAEATP